MPIPAKTAPPKKDRLRTMDVAMKLKCRYQKARDLMLAGKFGEPEYDAQNKLTVSREGVERFLAERAQKP
jgi:hypothetical protein